MSLLAWTLVQALSVAAAPPGRTVGALVLPAEPASEARVPQFETFINDALAQVPGNSVQRTEALFGMPEEEAALAAKTRADAEYQQALTAYEAKKWDVAERTLKASLKDYARASSVLKQCGRLCDATALSAALAFRRGDREETKLVLMDLLALGPTYDMSLKRFPKELVALRAAVAASRASALRGNLSIVTRPAGAKVFLDGENQGFSPATVTAVRTGKHWLRVERPGFKVGGQMLDVTAEDQDFKVDLQPTAPFRTYSSGLDRLAAEVKGPSAPSLPGLVGSRGLTHVVVGVLHEKPSSGDTELMLAYYDAKTGRQLAKKRVTFQGDEFGQLQAEVQRQVNLLLNERTSTAPKSSDPLQNRHGTENWGSEDHGEKPREEPKGDPLERKNGTEGW